MLERLADAEPRRAVSVLPQAFAATPSATSAASTVTVHLDELRILAHLVLGDWKMRLRSI